MLSLFIYYLFFIISIYFSYIYQKKYQSNNLKTYKSKKIICIIMIILPVVILQGLRKDVGTDFKAYEVLYNEIIQGPSNYYFQFYLSEPFYVLECIIIDFIFGNVIFFRIINAIIEGIFLFKTLDYFKDKINLPIAYSICYFLVYPHFFNGERQSLAIVLVWYSYTLIEEKKYFKYVLAVLSACFFHNTGIIGFVGVFIPLFKKIRITKKMRIALNCLLIIGCMFLKQIVIFFLTAIHSDYLNYIVIDGFADVSMAFLVPLFFVLFLLPYYKKIFYYLKNNFISQFLLKIYFIFIIIATFFSFGTRMFSFFDIVPIIMCSSIITKIENYRHRCIYSALYLVMSIIFFYLIYYMTGCDGIFPYNSII